MAHSRSLRVVPRSHLLEECQQPFSSQVLTFFLQTVDEMRAQKFCPASFSKSPTDILLPLPGHAHRAPSMALREKQRTCSKRFPERAAKAGRARGPTPQKSQNTREERREIECESDLRGVTLHFTWPQTPPATGGSSSSRNATRSGPLRLARSGALRLLYAPASAARVRDAGAFSARCARHNLIVGRPSGANKNRNTNNEQGTAASKGTCSE